MCPKPPNRRHFRRLIKLPRPPAPRLCYSDSLRSAGSHSSATVRTLHYFSDGLPGTWCSFTATYAQRLDMFGQIPARAMSTGGIFDLR
jgi:hypothetical protein